MRSRTDSVIDELDLPSATEGASRLDASDHFGVAPTTGASCDAIGLRSSFSGYTWGLLSRGCGVSGSAGTIRLALRMPVTLPCGVAQLARRFSG